MTFSSVVVLYSLPRMSMTYWNHYLELAEEEHRESTSTISQETEAVKDCRCICTLFRVKHYDNVGTYGKMICPCTEKLFWLQEINTFVSPTPKKLFIVHLHFIEFTALSLNLSPLILGNHVIFK